MLNKFVLGMGSVLAIIGLGAIVNLTVNYDPAANNKLIPPPDYTVADLAVPTTSSSSPLIGRHVKMREGWAIKFPAGTEGTIVAVPGSDDYCGHQDGTSVRWIDFPSKDPSCHWMSELEIEP